MSFVSDRESAGHRGAGSFLGLVAVNLILLPGPGSAQAGRSAPETQEEPGLRGDPAAIADAEGMVDAMGGREIWGELESLRFVHEWELFDRPDSFVENEILDLEGPRSYVSMESEIYHRIRAYSPEHRYWNIVDDRFSYAEEAAFERAMERAPYNIYRLARAIARGDGAFDVRFGPMRGVRGATGLEFRGLDGEVHGWILLNTRKEPVVWSTTQYTYVFGPLERFGNLRVPAWGTTAEGRVRYRMMSLAGSDERPDPSLFAPPEGRQPSPR